MTYLSEQDLLELHEFALRRYGGMAGVRDQGAIESCLAQPQTAVFGSERFGTMAEKAAAYCYFVIRLHPFNDGNKRTGVLAALHFLRCNGVPCELEPERTYSTICAVAAGTADIDRLIGLLREATRGQSDART